MLWCIGSFFAGFIYNTAVTTANKWFPDQRGLTAGLLDNGKPNASVLLSEVASELQRRYGVQASVMHLKGYFGTPAEESVIQRILHNCDFAVAGVGD